MLDRGRFALRLRDLLPRGRATRFEAKHLVFVGRTAHDFVFERPDWWVKQVARDRATSTCRPSGPTATSTSPTTARRSRSRATSSPGTRQETDTISRLVYGFATAYLLTGEDRFLEAAEKGTEYLRDHMRSVDADEDIAYWYHGIDIAGEQGEEALRLRVRRRLRRDPGLRADLRARRPDPDLPRHRRPADPERHRADASSSSTGSSSTARAAATSRTSTRSRSTRAARRSAHNQARKNWNSVGDHAPAYLINLWLATGDDAVRRLPRAHRRHDRQPLPRLRQQPVRAGALPRGLEPRPRLRAGSRTAPSSATT